MTTGRGHLVPPARPERVYLGLGGNQGDRLQALRRGLFALSCHPEIQVDVFSTVWETEYVGPGRQDPYLNLVVGARTELAPAALLGTIQ